MQKKKQMKLTFYGGVGWVTGANFVVENIPEQNTEKPHRIMIDCGMFQGGDDAREKNAMDFHYDPASIDVLLVTHAHADHLGRIPKLVRDGFRGKIYSTDATRDLAPLMFEDSLKIFDYEKKKYNREPLYSEEDVKKTLSLWKGVPFHSRLDLGQGFSVTLHVAGHILGSAMMKLSYGSRNMLFTGDLGNSPDPILKDTEEVKGIHYLLMESVYGDRNHEEREKRVEKLKQTILEVIAKKGALIIPSFALERTQNLLYTINNLVESGEIPQIPVFLDSPLSIKITNVFKKYTHLMNKDVQQKLQTDNDIFAFPGFVETFSIEESKAIAHRDNPKIIISSAGMSHAGRIIFHEKNYLSDEKNILLFVGYQAVGTLGRIIQDGAKKVKIFGKEIEVKAKIETISGYSAHKDSDHLLDFVSRMDENLEKVFVVMGETKSSEFLATKIRDYLGIEAIVPEQDASVLLDME